MGSVHCCNLGGLTISTVIYCVSGLCTQYSCYHARVMSISVEVLLLYM
jgi:hypothetical protein